MQTLETGSEINLSQSQIHTAPERPEAQPAAPSATSSTVFQDSQLPSSEAVTAPEIETTTGLETETAPEPKQTEPLTRRLRRRMDTFMLERPKEGDPQSRSLSKENAVTRWMGKHEYLLASLVPAVVWAASMPAPNSFIRALNFALALGATAMTPLAYEGAYAMDAKPEASNRAWSDHIDSLIVAPAFVPMTAIYAASKALVRGARFVAGLFNEETLARIRKPGS